MIWLNADSSQLQDAIARLSGDNYTGASWLASGFSLGLKPMKRGAAGQHNIRRQGEVMATQGKPSFEGSESTSTGKAIVRANDQSQLDFEIDFFSKILDQHSDYVDVLRVQGNNLTLKGRYAEGLQIDKRLIQLRPHDALAHYNLACSYALLKRPESAIKTLRKAVELGYRDFRYMREDHDLDSIRHDPRFRQLMREFEDR